MVRVQRKKPVKGFNFKKTDIYRNKGLYLLLIPSLAFVILFNYVPMAGIAIAFKKFDAHLGIFGSPGVGFANFKFFFKGSLWKNVIVNTLYLNILFIITGTVSSLVIAIMLSNLKKGKVLKVMQTFMTLPYFIGWTTVALFAVAFLSSDGIINAIAAVFGKNISFMTDPKVWPMTFVILRMWKTTGWSAIVFMAAILGIDQDIYEAARIDGASRFRCIFKITLPLIMDIVILMTILAIGSIFRGDLGMIYPFIGDNTFLFPTTDVIDSYIFRSIRLSPDYARSAAVGLIQSVMGFALVLLSNFIAKRYKPESAVF